MKISDVGEWLLFRHAPPNVFRRCRWFRFVGVDARRSLPAAAALERQSLYRRLPAVAAAKIGAGEIGMATAGRAFGADEESVFRTLTEVADLPAHGRDKNESGTCVKGVAGRARVWFGTKRIAEKSGPLDKREPRRSHENSIPKRVGFVIRRLFRLFHRYAVRHGQIQQPGFVLRNSAGHRFGHIDRIAIRNGRIAVDGWALSGKVGLANADRAVDRVPNMSRDDVMTKLDITDTKAVGFSLNLPLSTDHTVFWAETDGTRHVYTLPPITPRDLRAMRLTQLGPFLRDGLRALPAAMHWLIYRDVLSAIRVNTTLGLNSVPHSRQMNALLFAQDIETEDVPPDLLHDTQISIILPVYNALNLLPEVLTRVLEHTDLAWRLIVIEDCSSDSRVRPWLREWLAALGINTQARVTLIENETNLGFIRSVNRAFEIALPFGDHVVLLNSDAFVPAGWASRLIRPILEHDSVATVTPMSNDAEIFSVPAICRREQLVPGEGDAIDRVAAQFFPGADLVEAPTGVGFCMAMNIDFLRALPEFDTGFGRGYGEEVDWCQRVRQLGGRHLGMGGLFVEHYGGTSFGSEKKRDLIRKNSKTIARRYPSYDAEVQEFIRHDPMITPRLALAMAWVAERQKGAVPVYLAHSMGGGAENYLQHRLKSDLTHDAAAVVLRVGGLSRWQIELHTAHGITRGETDETAFVRRVLDILPAREIVYSCGVGDHDPVELPEVLLSLATSADDRIEVLIHDFLTLSPSYTLLDSDGIYHGVAMPEDNIDPAHDFRRPDGSKGSLGDWRAAWGALMEAAQRITVFSPNSRTVVATAYPQAAAQIVVTPHRLLTNIPRVQPEPARDGNPVIGVLGNIGHHKGAGILRALSQVLAQTGQARLVVVGNVDPAFPLDPTAQVHGDYRPEDIPALVTRYGISCWLIPSICPETFSYTTHEALATGLPVWSFDLGAQGDAVAAAAATVGHGGTIPLTGTAADVTAILDLVLRTFKNETV